MRVEIDAIGVEDLGGALESLGPELIAALTEAVKTGADVIQGAAKDYAPFRTGELRDGIISRPPVVSGGVIEAEVAATAKHSVFWEFGTGPRGAANPPASAKEHGVTYRPTGWVYPTEDGGFRFTQGIEAAPYMYPAAQEKKAEVDEIIADAVKRVVGG